MAEQEQDRDHKPKGPRDADPIQVRIRASSIVAVLASWQFSFRRQAPLKGRGRRRSPPKPTVR